MSSQNVELLRGVYESWGRGDFRTEAIYDRYFAVTLGPEFLDAGVHAGIEGVAAYMQGFLEPWKRITIEAEDLTEAGDRVLVRVLQSGVGVGSGADVELRYFQLWSFADGRPVAVESIKHEADARARIEAAQ